VKAQAQVLRSDNLRLREEARLAYILLLPAAIVLLLFMIYPIIYVFLMAFFRTDKIARLHEFTGLKNFISAMSDKEFWRVTFHSLYWTLFGVAVKTILGMVFALLLNVEYRGRKVARMLLIIPWASSVPISCMLWKWVYDPEFGLLNHTLKMLGLIDTSVVWLGYPNSAFLSTIWVDIWAGVPFMALVFLSGMQSIPKDLYESADIDGCNGFGKFTHITLPGIRYIILIATLLSALWTFNDFNCIYILTGGGPAGATDILITTIYKNGIAWFKFSNAAVMAVMTFLILSVVSIVYAKVYFGKEELE
jgi:multiple sugar transport system permease protein